MKRLVRIFLWGTMLVLQGLYLASLIWASLLDKAALLDSKLQSITPGLTAKEVLLILDEPGVVARFEPGGGGLDEPKEYDQVYVYSYDLNVMYGEVYVFFREGKVLYTRFSMGSDIFSLHPAGAVILCVCVAVGCFALYLLERKEAVGGRWYALTSLLLSWIAGMFDLMAAYPPSWFFLLVSFIFLLGAIILYISCLLYLLTAGGSKD